MTATEGSPVGTPTGRGPTAGDPAGARSLHHTTVVTPEGVVLEFRAAGVASRMLAVGLDLIIQFVLFLIVVLVSVVVGLVVSGGALIAVLLLVGLFLVFYGYPVLLETFANGRTVGKRVLGLRVLTIEGGPVRFRHAAIRALLGTIDFWLPAPGGIVALTSALTTKNSQRLGDLAAGTIVVRVPPEGASAFVFSPAFGAESYALTLDASRLRPDHYALAREFLGRAPELLAGPRHQLGNELAERLAVATENPRPPGLDAERYLQSLLFANQRRAREIDQALAPATAWSGSSMPPPSGSPAAGMPAPA